MNKYKMQEGGQQQPTPEEMAMMQQQQAAQQGGAPQQGGGQDEAMQQIMQMVEQMIQQGAQPADVAAELLGQQVPPEAIMQVFVEMGLPEQEAQAAIQQAMQAGPPAEGAPQGQPSPEEMAAMQQQMEKGGLVGDQDKLDVDGDGKLTKKDFASLKKAEYGDDVKESINRLQRTTITQRNPPPPPLDPPPAEPFVIDDLQQLRNTYGDVSIGANGVATDANGRIVGKGIRPEFHTTGKFTMGADPATFSENAGTPSILRDTGEFMPIGAIKNMQAGGDMFRKLMKKAWGGDLTKPFASSEDYVSDRAAMFVNAIKQNTAMSTLNESMKGDPFAKAGLPSKSLGGLPKFEGPDGSSDVNSETAGDNDLGFTDKQMEYIKNLTSGLNKVQQGIRNPNLQYQGFSGYNPYMNNQTVGYRDPRQFTRMDEIQRGMNPWARFLAGTGRTFSNPTIRGNNLPGGMSGADFLSQMKGMSGVGPDGTPYRVSSGERYVEKDGTFLKNLNPFVRRQPTRRGVRYNIDYGTGLTDGTQEGGASEEGAVPGTSGAMSKEDMLNSMTRNEKREFRKLQRGRNQVSANEAYDILKGDRGGTEDPAQTEQTTLEQMRANAAAAGDGLGADASERTSTLEEMRARMRGAEGDMIANTAAEVDPALADAGSKEAQGFQPMTEDDLTAKQRRQIKRGKTTLDDINQTAEREFDIQSQIDGAEQARIDEARAVMNDPNANVASSGFEGYKNRLKERYNKEGFAPGTFEKMSEATGQENISSQKNGKEFSYRNPGAALNQSAMENYWKDQRAEDAAGPKGNRYLNEFKLADLDPSRFEVNNPNLPTLQNPMGIQPMSIESLPVMGREKPAVSELQITDPNQEFGKRTTRQLQRKGVLDADGNVVPVEGEPQMPPTVEEMQRESDQKKKQELQESLNAAAEIRTANKQQARELFDAQNPIASSDKETARQRILELQAKGRESMDPFTLSEERMPAGSVPVQPGLTYGGGVSPQALANAVNLINMAFGGQAYSIPQATYGNMGMRMSNDSANVFSPEQIEAMKKMEAANSGTGTVDVAQEQGFKFAAQPFGQAMMNTAKVVNFLDARGEMNRAQDQNALRDQNAINTPDSYALSQVGLDNQFGQRFNTDFNNQVLNPTSNVGFGYGGGEYPFPQTMEYGGQYYEIGGDVDLTPEKLAEFEAAGFVLTRK